MLKKLFVGFGVFSATLSVWAALFAAAPVQAANVSYTLTDPQTITATGGAYGSAQVAYKSFFTGRSTIYFSAGNVNLVGQGNQQLTGCVLEIEYTPGNPGSYVLDSNPGSPTSPDNITNKDPNLPPTHTNPSTCDPRTSSILLGGNDNASNDALKISVAGQLTPAAPADPNANGSGSGDTTDQKCAQESVSFTWVICPAINFFHRLINYIYTSYIQPLLEVQPLNQDNNGTLYKVWLAMRDLADAFFVLIFLVIIFANIFSFDIDAYTVKKALPRLVMAALLVQFSFFICQILVDVGNVLGSGIGSLINTALGTTSGGGGGVGAVQGLISGFTVGGILTAGALTFVVLAGPTLALLIAGFALGILAFFLTLIFRQVLIAVLIILSPIALAAWVLPNTEGLFKKWWTNLVRAIMMYPLIVLILGAASIVASTAGGNCSPTAVSCGLGEVVKLLAPTIAFFMMPAAFKMAGGVMGVVATGVTRLRGRATQKVTGGQLAKDMRQAQHEKNLLRSTRPGLSGFLGKAGAAGIGGALGTKAGLRRLSAGREKLLQDRGKELGAQFTDMGLDGFSEQSAGQLADIVRAQDGQTVHGIRVDDAAKTKALEFLGRGKNYDLLAGLRGTVPPAVWQNGNAANASTIMSEAPDVIRGEAGFDGLSPEMQAKFVGNTAERMMRHVEGLRASGNTARADELTRQITANMVRISDSPALSNSMRREAIRAIVSRVGTGGELDGRIGKDGESFVKAPEPERPPQRVIVVNDERGDGGSGGAPTGLGG